MFDRATGGKSLLNSGCRIYQEIAKVADVMRATEPLRFGRMYYRQISGDGIHFGFPFGTTYTLAFSRLLYGREVLVAYNVSGQPRNDFVIVDAILHPPNTSGGAMTYLYGGNGTETVQSAGGARCVQLNLAAHQFVILA